MRTFRALALASAAAFLACAAEPAANTLTPEEKASGWALLFDGRTMQHWKDPRKLDPPGDAWTIDSECLKANARPRIVEDLFSEDAYRDFELQWDWRIAPGGNSGVKYRIQRNVWMTGDHPAATLRFEDQVEYFLQHPITKRPDRGQDYVIGFEYQMLDDKRNADAFAGKTHMTGALYDLVPPSQSVTKPAGEWNHSVLKVQGGHVEHWLNGVKVVDASIAPATVKPGLEKRWGKTPGVFDLLGNQPRKDCPISLQNHDADTWFRNIKIRRL